MRETLETTTAGTNGYMQPSQGLPAAAEPGATETTTSVLPSRRLISAVPELQALQRQRSVIIKSRIMQANRLQSVVAGTLGYSSSMAEKDRLKKFQEASAVIKQIANDEISSPFSGVVKTTLIGIDAFDVMQKSLEKEMGKLAAKLPVAAWVALPEQRGFGMPSLAVIVGEVGDFANYANPGKVWRRMGCAPWTFEDKTLMGSTWRFGKEGKLPASEWEAFGYSPRRRSIAYLIGENLVKGNREGPYRKRYDAKKQEFKAAHPDYSDLRCHRHGMLLAAKLLLKNLWIEWQK